MPIIKSAKKRVRVTARQTAENHLHRQRSRTAIKKVRDLLAAGKVKEAAAQVSVAQAYLDKAAKVRAFSPNTVARYKSRLVAAVKAAGNKDALTKKKAAPKGKAKATAPAKKPAASAKKAAPKKPASKPAAKPAPKSDQK